ncbi:lytic transglycosylase domain-containing protein [Maritimibacter alkaliphilus]|jgi:soluble lytic murein transglycosylase-like protein|uniref:lytic transglycosylase domain-containing protein n=1 Tax=Maritimibacter alkaliphilus TaxID=404236 RepID=UPI001C97EC59|nr:lytic transglycosylase domain-containing protein [Maritimibacter alkaliphilus]MBY6093001.1 lytic transglycosylase domain-containing protein [Maritimibacter alkaliphilus]
MRARGLLAALAALLAVPALAADGWSGFYTPTERPRMQRQAVVEDTGVCVREILKAQLRHGIPENILLGIGLQEAGLRRDGHFTVWPWAVNAEGTGRVFGSRNEALNWVADQKRQGVKSIDVGCMQINLHWHPEAFRSPAEGFDPATNVDYAARFLKSLYEKTGDWVTAAGSYHSFTPEKREIYLTSLRRNVTVANERIAEFRAMASGTDIQLAEAAPTPAPLQAGAFWSGQMTEGEGRWTLYSSREMQPILPNFEAMF